MSYGSHFLRHLNGFRRIFVLLAVLLCLGVHSPVASAGIISRSIDAAVAALMSVQTYMDDFYAGNEVAQEAQQTMIAIRENKDIINLQNAIRQLSSLKQGFSTINSIANTTEYIINQTDYYAKCIQYIQKQGTIEQVRAARNLCNMYLSQTRSLNKDCMSVIQNIEKYSSDLKTSKSSTLIDVMQMTDDALSDLQKSVYHVSGIIDASFDALMTASEMVQNSNAGAKLINSKII